MSIIAINKLALELVAKDFSDGHPPSNGGPTKTSRALAIIHLAARDAYAKVTGAYPARLPGLPNPPAGTGSSDDTGKSAVLGAGIRTATALYPDSSAFIAAQAQILSAGADPLATATDDPDPDKESGRYGAEVVASEQGHPEALALIVDAQKRAKSVAGKP